MELIVQIVAAAIGTVVFTKLLLLSVSVWKTSRSGYELNQRLSGSFRQVLKGQVISYQEGGVAGRDHRVCAGMAVDTKTNRVIRQGALSNETIVNSTY